MRSRARTTTIRQRRSAPLAADATGGVLLLAGTIAALVWANGPWRSSYATFWLRELDLLGVHEPLGHWVGSGLMSVFFLGVGIELARELSGGQLGSARQAALPVAAALGGMVVPAALFLAINTGGEGLHGWGVPMATDIAFALGVVGLLGSRVPRGVRVLLLAIAAVDDVGAILVIAVAYTDELHLGWLLAAAGGLVVVAALRRAHVHASGLYVVIGIAVWFCTHRSGVHATIAGVALGLLVPARPRTAGGTSTAERVAHRLEPWTTYVILPVFALANAGVPLSRTALADAATSRVTAGVVVGLVLGKLVGVALASFAAVRLGWARLPAAVGWRELVGTAAVAGTGFTVSLFVAGLAYPDDARLDDARIGILCASVLAGALGAALLTRAARRPGATHERGSGVGPR
jgi:NhaA family Na+:H+ antiporter